MTRRLCDPGYAATVPLSDPNVAYRRGCRGHVPKAPQRGPRTLLVQPLLPDRPDRLAPLPRLRPDTQTVETWQRKPEPDPKDRKHIAEPSASRRRKQSRTAATTL